MCSAVGVGPCGFAGLVKFNFLDNGGFAFPYGVSINISLGAVGGSPDFLLLNHDRSNILAVDNGFTCGSAVKGFNGVALFVLNSIFVLSVVLRNL